MSVGWLLRGPRLFSTGVLEEAVLFKRAFAQPIRQRKLRSATRLDVVKASQEECVFPHTPLCLFAAVFPPLACSSLRLQKQQKTQRVVPYFPICEHKQG